MNYAAVHAFTVFEIASQLNINREYASPVIPLYGIPFHIGFRPVSSDEDLYVLFYIVQEDGTMGFLPLIPYSEFLK